MVWNGIYQMTGLHEVMFVGALVGEINIKSVVVNTQGYPGVLVAEDNTIYNWENIISIKKKG